MLVRGVGSNLTIPGSQYPLSQVRAGETRRPPPVNVFNKGEKLHLTTVQWGSDAAGSPQSNCEGDRLRRAMWGGGDGDLSGTSSLPPAGAGSNGHSDICTAQAQIPVWQAG